MARKAPNDDVRREILSVYYAAPMALTLPEHVDAGRLAAQGATLEGEFPAAAVRRLSTAFTNVQPVAARIEFTLNEAKRVVLRGQVHGSVTAICQRCLQPVMLHLVGEFEHLPEEEEMLERGHAAGGTEPPPALDLLALVEDEMFLACPMIPKHPDQQCRPITEDDHRKRPGRENPFDVLATLRQNSNDRPRESDAALNPEE
jgi:uncharacterized protein